MAMGGEELAGFLKHRALEEEKRHGMCKADVEFREYDRQYEFFQRYFT